MSIKIFPKTLLYDFTLEKLCVRNEITEICNVFILPNPLNVSAVEELTENDIKYINSAKYLSLEHASL